MKLNLCHLSLEKLDSIPDKDRALLIVLSHAINEINVLNKLLVLSNNFELEPKWRTDAHVCQNLVLIRTTAGKLHEAWAVVEDGYFATQLSKTYDSKLDEKAKAGRTALKNFYGKQNAVSLIRNNFSFHYSLKHAEQAQFDGATQDDLPIYLGETNGNTLYQFAEFAMNNALMSAVNPNDLQQAFNQIVTDTTLAVKWFTNFAQGLIFSILDSHNAIPDDLPSLDIGDVPCSKDIHIPFYFDFAETDELV
jgi:hypothetical protein